MDSELCSYDPFVLTRSLLVVCGMIVISSFAINVLSVTLVLFCVIIYTATLFVDNSVNKENALFDVSDDDSDYVPLSSSDSDDDDDGDGDNVSGGDDGDGDNVSGDDDGDDGDGDNVSGDNDGDNVSGEDDAGAAADNVPPPLIEDDVFRTLCSIGAGTKITTEKE